MSGGSLNYLFCKTQAADIIERTEEMEYAESFLMDKGYIDIAKDVRRLIEYCKSASIRIEVLNENLHDVFHAVEWYMSGDYGDDNLEKELNKYRGEH